MTHLCRTLLVALLALPLGLSAQRVSYSYGHLETAAKKVGLATVIDTLHEGVTTLQAAGRSVTVRLNSDLQVEHIGLPLFSQEQRELMPSPVYDFLEYAVLDNLYKVSNNPFAYSNVKFQRGSWRELAALPDTLTCNLSNENNKLYRVEWLQGDKLAVSVSFPISYDMFSGASRKEMELNFVRDLRKFVGRSVRDTAAIDSADLEPADGGLYVRRGGSYILPTITDNTYFLRDQSGFHYVTSADLPAEALANMVIADDPTVTEADINVEFVLYAGATDSLLLPLKTFVRYCRSRGCRPYFGVESIEDNMMKAALFFYNRDSGYDHVIYLNAPLGQDDNQFGQADYTLRGTMYLYAPTNNVENLFDNPQKRKKKIQYEN